MKKLVTLILCFTTPSWGAIGQVQHKVGTAAALTVTATGSGNAGVAFCIATTGYPTGVTDNATGGSSTWTESTGCRGAFGGFQGTCFTSVALKSGATTITCAGTGAADTHFEELSGAATSSLVDASTGTVNGVCSGTACTGKTITTTNSGDAIVTFAWPSSSMTAAAAPYNTHFLADTNGVASSDHIPSGIVTEAATWTDAASGDNFANAVIAILPAAGGAAAVICPQPFCGVIGQ